MPPLAVLDISPLSRLSLSFFFVPSLGQEKKEYRMRFVLNVLKEKKKSGPLQRTCPKLSPGEEEEKSFSHKDLSPRQKTFLYSQYFLFLFNRSSDIVSYQYTQLHCIVKSNSLYHITFPRESTRVISACNTRSSHLGDSARTEQEDDSQNRAARAA